MAANDGFDGRGKDLQGGRARAAAEEIRSHRASLVEEVASGALTIDGLLAEQAGGGLVRTIKVVVLAQRVPGVGKVRARRAMAEVGIGEDTRWGEVDEVLLRALWSEMADAANHPITNRRAQSDSGKSSPMSSR